MVYSSGGTKSHPNYPNDLDSSTGQTRVAQGLYVINPHHPKGRDLLCRIDIHPLMKLSFDLLYKFDFLECSNRRPRGWSLMPGFLRSLFDYSDDELDKMDRNTENTELLSTAPSLGDNGPVLVISAHLRAPDMNLTAPTPREVLFCRGDSGSGVLDSSGRLIGVILALSLKGIEHISQGDTSFPFDPIATKELGCRHVVMAADIHEHSHWIETTLHAAL